MQVESLLPVLMLSIIQADKITRLVANVVQRKIYYESNRLRICATVRAVPGGGGGGGSDCSEGDE